MSAMEKAAVGYANLGWCVFPIMANGKEPPLIKNWEGGATKNLNRIHEWWTKWPNANIGIACGPSKIVVVDCDVKNTHANGKETWRDIVLEHDLDDDTIIQLTPTGGQHLVFGANGKEIRNSAGKLGPGIDIRGAGGYIVVAPSIVPPGQYMWDVVSHPMKKKMLPIPQRLAALLIEESKIGQVSPPIGNAIYAGQRNEVLTSLAGTMRRKGMVEEEIEAALLVVNQRRCLPPLDEMEIRRIAQSVSRYEPATIGLTRVYPLTDMGNSERLVSAHGSTLRYCHAWGRWLHWNGQRWALDEDGEVTRRAEETVRIIEKEAEQGATEEIKSAINKWAKSSESRPKLTAMIELAEADNTIGAKPEEFDNSPMLLCVNNGVIDLTTGELHDACPERMLTKLVPVNYDPTALCPQWLAFLTRVMDHNFGLISYLQRVVGYALSGNTQEQCLFILHGVGANGKSTFLETVSTMLNDYAMRTPTDTLLIKRSGAIPNDVARLKGARLVTAVEADEGRRMAESLVKQMTGGERITARFLHREWFEFKPEFKIFLATNHKPTILGTDHAIWRRIHLIPFSVVIPEAEQDKHLSDKLRDEELPGILNWAVEGCLGWQKVGLHPPEEVIGATGKYRSEMDAIAAFLADCCFQQSGIVTAMASVYTAYTAWCDENREKALTKRELTTRLEERGLTNRRGSGGIHNWQGLGLISKPNQGELGV